MSQITVGYSQMNENSNIISSAPHAEKVKYQHTEHGKARADDYNWLRDDNRKDKKVIEYLKQENSYTDTILEDEKPLIDTLYNEMVTRLPTKEQSVPSKIDDYWYYSRYPERSEYEIYARKKAVLAAKEEIMIDLNQRAKGKSYYQSNYQAISPNHKIQVIIDGHRYNLS